MPPEEDEPMEMKVRREQLNESRNAKIDRATGRFNVRNTETAANREKAQKPGDRKPK